MAEGGNVPELGGYEYEFTSKVPEDLECLVCHLAMKDPVQIVGCGHRLCNICMESLFRRPSPTCPADRAPLSRDKIFPDAACHRKILDITVKCPHVGCSWTGELRTVEKHQLECPFKVVKCPYSGCTETIIMRDLHGHVTNECRWRKVNCEYCQETFVMNEKEEHFGVCRKFPVQCTNKCDLKRIPREEFDVHIRNKCPATEVQCQYKNLGCKGKFPRSSAKLHSKTQVERHLNLALHCLEATQLQVNELVSLGKDQSQQIERLTSKNTEQSQQIERLMSKVKEQSQQIEKLGKFIFTINSTFKWEIPHLEALWERASRVEQTRVSEPFYLCGYRYLLKMVVRYRTKRQGILLSLVNFYPHDNGVFLYIKIVPGEFDSFLSWPCNERVRVKLIDQDPCPNDRDNVSCFINFENGEKPCEKPLTESSQEYRFIRYLDIDTLKTRSYIKDDTIMIMVNKY